MTRARNDNQVFATSFYKEISNYASQSRDRVLYRAFKYFRNNNLPISDLAGIADMSRQALYNIISKQSKREANNE